MCFNSSLLSLKSRFPFQSLHIKSRIINNLIRFDGISVALSGSTTFGHNDIYHLANYLGQPFTTGNGLYPSHAKTEIMRLESGEWESGPDYPFQSRYVYF